MKKCLIIFAVAGIFALMRLLLKSNGIENISLFTDTIVW